MLIAVGNFTSATELMRLQYEALVRAMWVWMWVFYAASDGFMEKLSASLTEEAARKAATLPMVGALPPPAGLLLRWVPIPLEPRL